MTKRLNGKFIGILFLLLKLQMIITTDAVTIQAEVGSNVTFPLTSFQFCQNLTFSDPDDILLLKVTHGRAMLSFHMTIRSRLDIVQGQEVFILMDVQERDAGTYVLDALAGLENECGRVFDLKVNQIAPQIYWLEWTSWSCDYNGNCGVGEIERTRECSILKACTDGLSYECMTDETCSQTSWGKWTEWSECSSNCYRSRRRGCLSNHLNTYVRDEKCRGDPNEKIQCQCSNVVGSNPSFAFEWSVWSRWSTCSVSCDTGWMSRDRKCTNQHNRDEFGRCTGDSKENRTCASISCKASKGLFGSDPKVALPLSVIVGIGAGVFIIILIVVIVALVVVLKRRFRRRAVEDGQQTPKAKQKRYRKDKKSKVTRPKSRLTESKIYAEINDDDVHVEVEKKPSITTIDNTYAPLPRSGSDGYENTLNIDLGSRSFAEPSTYANVKQEATLSKRNKRTDSAGYLVPMQSVKKSGKQNNRKS